MEQTQAIIEDPESHTEDEAETKTNKQVNSLFLFFSCIMIFLLSSFNRVVLYYFIILINLNEWNNFVLSLFLKKQLKKKKNKYLNFKIDKILNISRNYIDNFLIV